MFLLHAIASKDKKTKKQNISFHPLETFPD